MAVDRHVLDEQLAGLDDLDLVASPARSRGRRLWAATWPKLAAGALAVATWQVVVWSHWKPDYALPGPVPVLSELGRQIRLVTFWEAVGQTLRRAVTGYALALVLGSIVGLAVARVRILRAAFGSLITGLQTMPSIAWFPLAILLLRLSEGAIFFVVVLGAAPAIANGLIAGVDHIPPLLLRSGRMLGARGLALYRHVVIPAALPSFIGGLKQGWAFAWRSLMAGELLVVVPGHPSIGQRLQFARELSDARALLATMLVILAVGIVVDSIFTAADGVVRRRWGLVDLAA